MSIFRNLAAQIERFKNMRQAKKFLAKNYDKIEPFFNDYFGKYLDAAKPPNPIPASFYRAIQSKDFEKLYTDLIRGLDEKSCTQVAEIINNVRRQGEGKAPFLPVSEADRRFMREAIFEFENHVVKVTDELYTYRCYRLPLILGLDSLLLLYHKHYVEYIDDLEFLRNKNFIDCGAYIGDSALALSPYTDGTIHSFEAAPDTVKLFNKTIALNNVRNVKLEEFLLGDTCKTVEMLYFPNIASASHSADIERTAAKSRQQEIVHTVKQTTIDAIVAEQGLQNIGLIKADIEGAETAMLHGAINTIKRDRPVLMICIYHNPKDFFGIKPLIESWDLGYTFKVRRCPVFMLGETMLIAEVPKDRR